VMRYKAMAKKLRQVVGLADPVPAEAVLAEPRRGEGDGKRDYGEYEILGQGQEDSLNAQSGLETRAEVPDKESERVKVRGKDTGKAKGPDSAVLRARAVWLEVVAGVRSNPTALMERLDALTDPERVEDANMLAGWRAKYENEITGRMKSRREMVRKRDVG